MRPQRCEGMGCIGGAASRGAQPQLNIQPSEIAIAAGDQPSMLCESLQMSACCHHDGETAHDLCIKPVPASGLPDPDTAADLQMRELLPACWTRVTASIMSKERCP